MSDKSKKISAKKITHLLMLIIGIALIINFNLAQRKNKSNQDPTLEQLKEVFRGDVDGKLNKKPLLHYTGTVESGKITTPAVCVSTIQTGPVYKGYVDAINTLVVLDENGLISGIKIISHNETPEYMRRIIDDGFVERIIGRDIRNGLSDIDLVTGASITALAMRNDIEASAGQAASLVYSIDVTIPKVPSWKTAMRGPLFIAVFIALLIALYAKFGRFPQAHRNTASWIISITLIGVFAMTPFTLTHISQLLKLNFPGPGNSLLALLIVFILVTSLLWGEIWCQYACPFGAIQELLSKLPIKRWKVSQRILTAARELRYLVLLVCIIGIFGFDKESISSVEPFTHLFGRSEMPAAWLFVFVVLLASVFVKRFWCRFFCPTGTCIMMVSNIRKSEGANDPTG
jgi:NosR/NirI family transcriptional regulator, nitrous oxide reductase regulator